MTVAHLPPDHLLLLNKYPVISRHFLLVTRQFKEQSGDLDIGDLAAMYGCLEAWERRRGGEEEEEEEEEEAHGEGAKEEDGTDWSEKRRGASRASRAIGDENGNGNGDGSKEPQTGSTNDRRQLYAFYNCGESSGGMITSTNFSCSSFVPAPAQFEHQNADFQARVDKQQANRIDIFNFFQLKI